jgi:hypothetical protein
VRYTTDIFGIEAAARSEAPGDAAEFARMRLGLDLDARQTEVLKSDTKRGILNCSRQWGKSTLAAAKAVHRAYTREKSLVLVASPSDRQSTELLKKARGMVRQLGIRACGDGGADASLLFPNGSRIVALPGAEGTVRGFSAPSLILIDEASRVEDEMYKALRPMLAVGDGDLWLMSTPWGRRGFFWETWEFGGGEEWMRVRVPATECSRISAKFLEEERRVQARWFAQEYLCEFMDNGMTMFGRDVVEAALDSSVRGFEFAGLWT